MGGNAFLQTHPSLSFPRIPTQVYNCLKVRLTQKIQSIYLHVAVPFEAPQKLDHGDLDFVVACPNDYEVAQELVRTVLGAKFCILLEGNRTSNFAVPFEKEEEEWCGEEKFYQVDIHVCADRDEWERVVFFHGYGDLGMMVGLIAKNNGLALGIKGLKIPDPPYPPFRLSSSPSEITRFLGLSMDEWERGFETRLDIFKWVASSRFFNSSTLRVNGPGIKKVKEVRTMYTEFINWAVESGPNRETVVDENATQEALVFFNKKEEFESLGRARLARVQLKEFFNGTVVNEWAGLGGNWRQVKMVMDGVREKHGGNDGVSRILESEGEQGLKRIVLLELQPGPTIMSPESK